jgi:HEAT repeat protein
MISRARSKAIHGLIAGTLALCSHFPDASAADSPDPFVEALVSEIEHGELEPLDRKSALRRLATSLHRAVRVRVAEAAGALSSEEPEAALPILRQLCHDPSGEVRSAAARGLAEFIRHATGPLRCAVESEWVTRGTTDERVALARALGMSAPDWLTDLALVELAADGRATVRRAALLAAGLQLGRNPNVYVRLATRYVTDPDRSVRKAARQALRRPEARGWLASLRPSPQALRESRKRFRRAMRDREPRLARSLPA